MVDLRTVPIVERRALCVEVERRARAGEEPVAIRETLGISHKTYSSWAKQFGFRQQDIDPETPRPGARAVLPPGPGGYVKSGRYYRGEGAPEDAAVRITGEGHPGWTGGEGASRARYATLRQEQRDTAARAVEALSPRQLLSRVEAALDAGELTQADRLLFAWRAKARREAGLAALRKAAASAGRGGEGMASDGLPEDWTPDMDWGGLRIAELNEAHQMVFIEQLMAGLEEN